MAKCTCTWLHHPLKLLPSTSFFAMYQFKSARMVSCWDLLYGVKPWHCRSLTKLMTNQKFFKFSPSKFLYIYSKVSREYQTNWRHSWHMPNNLQGIIDNPLDNADSVNFSFTRQFFICQRVISYRLVLMVASNHWTYTQCASCHFTLLWLTIKLSDIVEYRLCYFET